MMQRFVRTVLFILAFFITPIRPGQIIGELEVVGLDDAPAVSTVANAKRSASEIHDRAKSFLTPDSVSHGSVL